MAENHHLLQPLTYPSTTTTTATQEDHDHLSHLKLLSSNSGIIFRLSLVVFIAIISIWANHEASKGFAITIVNEARNTFPGNRFQVLYISNDEATRTLIKASKIVENFLYPDDDSPTKKPIKSVIFKLVGRQMIDKVVVDSRVDHEFVLNISPSIMEGTNFGHDMFIAVLQGMSRIWLWDGQDKVPKILINGIVEYMTIYLVSNFDNAKPSELSISAATDTTATACWKRDDSREVAEFLNYCERRRPGFIRRLNQAMKDDGWHDSKLDVALGQPVQNLCTTYESLRKGKVAKYWLHCAGPPHGSGISPQRSDMWGQNMPIRMQSHRVVQCMYTSYK